MQALASKASDGISSEAKRDLEDSHGHGHCDNHNHGHGHGHGHGYGHDDGRKNNQTSKTFEGKEITENHEENKDHTHGPGCGHMALMHMCGSEEDSHGTLGFLLDDGTFDCYEVAT